MSIVIPQFQKNYLYLYFIICFISYILMEGLIPTSCSSVSVKYCQFCMRNIILILREQIFNIYYVHRAMIKNGGTKRNIY